MDYKERETCVDLCFLLLLIASTRADERERDTLEEEMRLVHEVPKSPLCLETRGERGSSEATTMSLTRDVLR